MTTGHAPRQKKCPYCAELLGFGKVHICPIGCCYVGVGEKALVITCSYCGTAFKTGQGHVCLELIKTGHAELTSPVDLRVDGRRIRVEKTILAVGSRTATVTLPGLAEVGFITNH